MIYYVIGIVIFVIFGIIAINIQPTDNGSDL
jgi:hypothetical protein